MSKKDSGTKRRGGNGTAAPAGRGKRAIGGKTDWARVDAKTEEDLAADIASDPDAAEFTDEMFAAAQWVVPNQKREQIAREVGREVLAFFKAPGPGYETRMNNVLRAYMERSKKAK